MRSVPVLPHHLPVPRRGAAVAALEPVDDAYDRLRRQPVDGQWHVRGVVVVIGYKPLDVCVDLPPDVEIDLMLVTEVAAERGRAERVLAAVPNAQEHVELGIQRDPRPER